MMFVQHGFEIIFEDPHILVVNKPAGIGTQAPPQYDSLEARVRRYQRQTGPVGMVPYLGIPHRLDRCVSGVVVFAKRKKAAQRLCRQFERREVDKQYHALVTGHVTPPSDTWSDYLRKVPREPRAEVVDRENPDGRLAVLSYLVEETVGRSCRLRIRLETGRMHQIRIQCASRGYPVLGDVVYGSRQPFGAPFEHERERAIALHASTIGFAHPKSREAVCFRAAFSPDWQPYLPHLPGGNGVAERTEPTGPKN